MTPSNGRRSRLPFGYAMKKPDAPREDIRLLMHAIERLLGRVG